ncbi:tRNA (adenosine(37)-N6)-dimethylallyltransferase MiaA [bacterium]|jgi:tRNA dimethylallyltransferase|nr:tRNA (adenosine(37)-N6)-dimethylallyltransferase MiaA [bacterium]
MENIFIIGPTAIGKSEYALNLALSMKGDIVSADAFQVYKGMDIGTAKVLESEQKSINHHLIDILEPDEPYSVVEFIRRSNFLIEESKKNGSPLIFCGGTGFYVNAFLYNYELTGPGENTDIRNELMLEKKGKENDYLWNKLEKLDKEASINLNPNDEKRIIRAIEYKLETGLSITSLKKNTSVRPGFKVIGLTAERDLIRKRIDERVDRMFDAGLVGEVRALLEKGYSPKLKAFEAIGYKEVIAHLEGSMGLEEVIILVKSKTRQFAKRQMNWFKRVQNVEWITIK